MIGATLPLVADSQAVLVIVLVSFLAILAYQIFDSYRGIDRRPDDHIEDRGSDLVLAVTTIACNCAAGAWALWIHVGVIGARTTVVVLGLVMMWTGFAFRAWSRRLLGRWFHPVVTAKAQHELIRRGPYRWVRHPIYLGILLTFSGLGVALGTWPSIVLTTIPTFLALGYVIRVEEKVLSQRLGNPYASYLDETWRMFPGIW